MACISSDQRRWDRIAPGPKGGRPKNRTTENDPNLAKYAVLNGLRDYRDDLKAYINRKLEKLGRVDARIKQMEGEA